MASSPLTNFVAMYMPTLWAAEFAVFGCQVSYAPDAGASMMLDVLWKEGAEAEEVSPGRYSNITVRQSDFTDLGLSPDLGDVVTNNGVIYDVVRVDATKVGVFRLVLQERP
ncbi:MAG TPA: hypothetical protein VGF16_16570 [Bryobacteraceae bacterium]|jgi:hypothetical protein